MSRESRRKPVKSINPAVPHILSSEQNCVRKGGIVLSSWKQDLRLGTLGLLALTMSALPWVWLMMSWLQAQDEANVAAMGRPDAPCVAITFDDGPRAETTSVLLDGLAQRGVHATFFVIGTRLEGNELLIQRMVGEGHQVGIHSQNHKVLTELGAADFYTEVDQLRITLSALLGQEDFMLRPPYGLTSASVCRRAGAPIILWAVDPEDWSDRDTKRQVELILEQVEDGDIILLHDIYASSVETALQVVDSLMAEGYYFVTVEELFAIRGIEPEAGRIYRSLPPK